MHLRIVYLIGMIFFPLQTLFQQQSTLSLKMTSIGTLKYMISDPHIKNHVNCSISSYPNPEYTCIFDFPCPNPTNCTYYELEFLPNIYEISLYGPSGGTTPIESSYYLNHLDELPNYVASPRDPDNNGSCLLTDDEVKRVGGTVICDTSILGRSVPGAGGYSKGKLRLQNQTKGFLHLGGRGFYETNTTKKSCRDDTTLCTDTSIFLPGGYNGGGRGFGSAYGISGAGATDLRMIKNDFFHRILVAGGGGSSDDIATQIVYSEDDGSGGAEGNEEAQSFWHNGIYQNDTLATQTSGYSFGNGQAPTFTSVDSCSDDAPGGSGGWFGSYASKSVSSGAGGGSSFALTNQTIFSKEMNFTVKDDLGEELDNQPYAFDNNSEYVLEEVEMRAGVWKGNGRAIIKFPIIGIGTNSFSSDFGEIFNPYEKPIYIIVFFGHFYIAL